MLSIDSIIADLKMTYPADYSAQASGPAHLTEKDVQKWTEGLVITRSAFYDVIALKLAQDFHSGQQPFWFCDDVINCLQGIIAQSGEEFTELFWDVFLAFDAGEFYPKGKPRKDPIETYTRPAITSILEKYKRV
jgi:hypothetical protein